MNTTVEAGREGREGGEIERNIDVFLYSSENNNDGESCNIVCLLLLFISLFLVMLITADNTVTNNYENGRESEVVPEKNAPQDRITNEWLDNILIQSLSFKGYYMVHDKLGKRNVGFTKRTDRNDNGKKNKRDENIGKNKNEREDKNHVKKGVFEAKLITLRLAMNNASKAYIFFHFQPPNGSMKVKKKNRKYQFVGISGLNINKNDHFIFSGLGYNISNFCQNIDENCICNYSINIKQNIRDYESTSLRELDESYLYALKNYLLDESEYFKAYLYDQYYQQYKDYLHNMNKFFYDKFANININDTTAFISIREKDVRPEFVKQYGNKGITQDGYTYDLHNDEQMKTDDSEYTSNKNANEGQLNIGKQIDEEKKENENENKNKKKKEGDGGVVGDGDKDGDNDGNGDKEKDKKQQQKAEQTDIYKKDEMTDDSVDQSGVKSESGEEDTAEEKEGKEEEEKEEETEEEEKEEGKNQKNDYEGHIISNNCNFYISLNGNDIDKDIIIKKVVNFSIIFNIKSIIELVLFWKQIGNSENMHTAAKVSLLSICLNSFIEIFESLLLYEVMLSKLLLVHFISMVLLKFLLFTLMEVRYVLIIWKANHQHEMSEGWEAMQRKLSKLYKYYYGSILLVILLFYYVFPFYPYALLVLYLCWFPQICLDIWKGQRKSVNLKFVFLLSLCRIFLPIYIFLYPNNIFQVDTFVQLIDTSNITFSILLIIIILVQLSFMLIQRIYGPRCFFNVDLLPHVHNYYKTVDVNFEAGIPECVICMYDILLKEKKYCVTPCYHIFHEKCLQQWMNVKLECPTCRGVLPNFP